MASTTTQWDIQNLVFPLMAESSNNTTYTSNGRITFKINDVVSRICSGYFPSALDPKAPAFKCLDMPFLRDTQAFEYIAPIVSTADAEVGDITIDMDTSTLDTAWYLIAQGVIIWYTGKTSTSITGVTWVISKFKAGTIFTKCFLVNANFDRSYRLFYQYNSEFMPVMEVQREDDRYEREKIQSFMIAHDDTTGKQFIVIRWFSNWDRFLLKYYKLITPMVDDADICVIPDEYCLSVVANIVAWELLMESQTEDQEYINKLVLWYNSLLWMYTRFTTQEVDMDKMYKLKPYNYSSIQWYGAWGAYGSRYTRSGFRLY